MHFCLTLKNRATGVCNILQTIRLNNLLHDAINFGNRSVFIPVCTGDNLEQIFKTTVSMSMEMDDRRDVSFAPLVQHVHSTPAIVFPCVLARSLRFDQDGPSFASFEHGFGLVA